MKQEIEKYFPPISKMDTETTDPPNSSNEVLKWAWRSCGWFEHSESWKKSPMGPDLSVEKVISWPKVRIPPWFRLIFDQKWMNFVVKNWTKIISNECKYYYTSWEFIWGTFHGQNRRNQPRISNVDSLKTLSNFNITQKLIDFIGKNWIKPMKKDSWRYR